LVRRDTKNALRVAFQGERGAFSEEALQSLCGPESDAIPCERFADVFQSVVSRATNAAVIPIENTLHGSVHENYDRLLASPLLIAAETQVRIVHNVIAAPGVKMTQIKQIYSHPVALNQCQTFFKNHPEIEQCPFYDTAGSVKMIIGKNLTNSAAIASSVASEIYGGRILKRSIEDDRQNFTRFFLLLRRNDARRRLQRAEGDWKTSVVFTIRNQPGAIFRALGVFALRDLSLTKIESRPLRGKPWEYLFYLDFVGRADEPASKNALAHLAELADFLRVLGSYPRGC
jgi:prephenate dehydratase